MSLSRFRKFVRDLMQIGVVTCPPETTVSDLAGIILVKDLDSIIVLNPEDDNAISFVSQSDLLQTYAKESADNLTAFDIMRENIPQIQPDNPIEIAIQMMLDNNSRTNFIMHHSGGVIYPAAYISYKNILRHFAAKEEQDLSGLGVVA